jgi:hypothetical protein
MVEIPKVVFIVPYRNRENHLNLFCRQMEYILEETSIQSHQILIIEQKDNRDFNRGAMKNIGFLLVREKYPDDYHNITLVFNDIDTMPFVKNTFPYQTIHGNVKHFYGFQFALGGIVSITGKDYETIGGFPNFWAWGFEDNELQNRVMKHKLKIDRSTFYNILDENVIHLQHGYTRGVNIQEKKRYVNQTTDGFSHIRSLEYTVEKGFNNNARIQKVHVNRFDTPFMPTTKTMQHELSKGTPFKHVKRKMNMKYYPKTGPR